MRWYLGLVFSIFGSTCLVKGFEELYFVVISRSLTSHLSELSPTFMPEVYEGGGKK
jgi:hypothetical protein